MIDLQTFLPNTFVASGASSIDAAGDIFGAANGTDGVSHAIEWLPWLLPGDTIRDGIVNAQDIGLIATNWLKTGLGGPGDANDDGIVNGQDIAVIAEHWLQTSGGSIPRCYGSRTLWLGDSGPWCRDCLRPPQGKSIASGVAKSHPKSDSVQREARQP